MERRAKGYGEFGHPYQDASRAREGERMSAWTSKVIFDGFLERRYFFICLI